MSMEKTLGEIEGMLSGLKGGSSNGMDPAYLMSMMNQNGLGGNNSWFLIFFLLLLGRGGNLLGGNDQTASAIEGQIEAAINKASANQASFQAIKDAVMGNGADLRQLAQTLNCDINALTSAIGDMKASLGMIEKEIGCSADRTIAVVNEKAGAIINTIINQGCEIKTAIKDCCCEVLRTIEKGFSDNALRDQSNFSAVQLAIRDASQVTKDTATQTQQMILQTQQIIKDTAKDAENRELREKLEDARRSEQTQTLLSQLAKK